VDVFLDDRMTWLFYGQTNQSEAKPHRHYTVEETKKEISDHGVVK